MPNNWSKSPSSAVFWNGIFLVNVPGNLEDEGGFGGVRGIGRFDGIFILLRGMMC